MAYYKERPIGFKIGYDRFGDGSFYTWMGSVLPEYRRCGIAQALARKQEFWAKEQGFTSIKLKTRRKYKAMIAFVKTFGFALTEEIPKIPRPETRIIFEKSLTQ